MFNRIILIGRLTRDPEIRYAPSGLPVASFGLAVNTRSKQADEYKDEVLFIDCVVFGKQAESCGQYLNKGNLTLVEGRLRERKWEYEGQKKSKMEVIANSVRFLQSKKDSAAAEPFHEDLVPPEEITKEEPF
ncbi:MAG: single-stranded DNA-binding protein [Thermodesulfovibrionales bacterium]|nr:single-stranded DNA-binding protein [Thermodesulfovibrionales bacterium]